MTTIVYGKSVNPVINARSRRQKRRKAEAVRRWNWITAKERMPEIKDKVLICNNNTKGQLVGVYLGNGQFHYADCCQGIRKTCTASHWMPVPELPKPPGNDKNAKPNSETLP
ncbi:hypothetical protein CBG25_00995 [Arsenophonus sp. ENCA]|uniref:DUF551 domain-containing protein n=1 Tax=Arsenophonus sp. ENCA TaxID=1987579 RepID=UPI000BD7728F|nr:DUF551 domain-containing protein [Arsenophonus sp. ENCA]PAV10898.1 hypothetical protein CBG25_00995 [Arsenophonus sp. ENCA]